MRGLPVPMRCTASLIPFAEIVSSSPPASAPVAAGALRSAPSVAEIWPNVAPTPNSPPSSANTVSTPVTSASISLLSLSVSTSQIGSPAVTVSPLCLCQRTTLPAVMVMPSLGIIISITSIRARSFFYTETKPGDRTDNCTDRPSDTFTYQTPPVLLPQSSPEREDRHPQAQG